MITSRNSTKPLGESKSPLIGNLFLGRKPKSDAARIIGWVFFSICSCSESCVILYDCTIQNNLIILFLLMLTCQWKYNKYTIKKSDVFLFCILLKRKTEHFQYPMLMSE